MKFPVLAPDAVKLALYANLPFGLSATAAKDAVLNVYELLTSTTVLLLSIEVPPLYSVNVPIVGAMYVINIVLMIDSKLVPASKVLGSVAPPTATFAVIPVCKTVFAEIDELYANDEVPAN